MLPGGTYAVAVSGGADSAVVAWALAEVAGRHAIRGLHVHHNQDASNALAIAAQAVADHIGITLERLDVVVPAEGSSFEGKAREVRLGAIESASRNDEWLVTGHHAGDSAETVLANLLRGAGATGLSGIRPTRDRWLRPLIEVDADTVRAAAEELAVPFLDDPANSDLRHRRNVIRTEVMPWLAERLDVPIAAVVKRSADALAADDDLLEESAAAVPVRDGFGAITLPATVLTTVPEPIAARVARRALRQAHPPYPGSASDVAGLLAVAAGTANHANLAGEFHAVREGALVAVYQGPSEQPVPQPIGPGVSVTFGPWQVAMSAAEISRPPRVGRSRVVVRAGEWSDGAEVRSAIDGERVALAGGSKAVRDAMAEAGIPPRLRSAWPVVAVGGKIAWVAGGRIAEWARVDRVVDAPGHELSIEGMGV